MTGKKIAFGAKPTSQPTLPPQADDWVESRTAAPAEVEPMKRLTIDIPESLHRAIKSTCAGRGTKIADELREMLLEKYGNK